MNVLIIPEDFRKDQHIVKPIIQRMFAEVGKPRANVRVCQDPLMGGISEILKWGRVNEVIDMYPQVHIFLILVDRDGQVGRRTALDNLQHKATERFVNDQFAANRILVAENAWQEIEVWALAGQNLPGNWRWQDIRTEMNPKEIYFAPWAEQRGLTKEPGEGRTTMGREAAANYARVRARCREDIEALETRLSTWLNENQ